MAAYDHDVTQHEWATGYRWDIVLTGSHRTPLDRSCRGGPRVTPTPTPGQTVGPFFDYALPYDGDSELVPPGTAGAVRLHGTVYDGAGEPVPDAILEIWQADAAGEVVQQAGSLHRDGWTFTGFGRRATDAEGHYSFTTLVPAPEPGRRSSR